MLAYYTWIPRFNFQPHRQNVLSVVDLQSQDLGDGGKRIRSSSTFSDTWGTESQTSEYSTVGIRSEKNGLCVLVPT